MPEPVQRRLVAILAADVVGYSRLMGRDEAGTLGRLKALLHDVIDPEIAARGGRVVKLMGDGVLAEFASVVDAVACAVAVQRAAAARAAAEAEDRRIVLRIGVNLGDVIVDGDDLYGDGVNVAARLEAIAEPGGIVVSGTAWDHAHNKVDAGFESMGEVVLKNIAEPVRAYRVRDATEHASAPSRRPARGGATRLRLTGLAAALLALAAVAVAVLWPEGPSAPPQAPSIAVLRFATLGAGDEEAYFADGMTNDLITDLSKIAGLMVIARSSAFAYDAEPEDVRRVADELGVRYVLEGSVQRAGEQVRINARLIDGTTGNHVWAERYERQMTDIFALQDEVIAAVVAALSVELTESEASRIGRLPTANLEAYDHYLRAEQKAYTVRAETLLEVLGLYEEAVTLDPDFADAHAGYARVLVDVLGFDYADLVLGAVAREEAYEAAGRALALDPGNARAYSVLGILQMLDGAHEQALASLERAVSLDPGGAESRLDRAVVLTYAGLHAEALAEMETVLRLNPQPPSQVYDYYGLVLFMNRRFSEAVAALEKVQAGARSDFGLEALAMAHARLGNAQAASDAVDTLRVRSPLVCLSFIRILYAHHRLAENLEFRLQALADAGVPEWPGGFTVRPDDRLAADALAALVLGRTWEGSRRLDGRPMAMQVSAAGAMALRVADGLITGSAAVEGDMLCIRSPAALLGRRFCGAVYRNPTGSAEMRNAYYYPSVLGVFYFDVR